MTRFLAFLLFTATATHAGPPLLQSLTFEVIRDIRIFKRSITDNYHSIWTEKASATEPLLRSFGIESKNVPLKPGHIMAIFLNDNFREDLTAIVYNKSSNQTFADYADSGIEFRLKPPEEGTKYTHLTVVVFAPAVSPSHLGLRGMISGGLSQKSKQY